MSNIGLMAVAAVVEEVLERRSKSLFGNRHMLRVAHDIAGRNDPFTVQDVARETKVPYSSTHRLVRQLEDVGLVKSTPPQLPEPHRWTPVRRISSGLRLRSCAHPTRRSQSGATPRGRRPAMLELLRDGLGLESWVPSGDVVQVPSGGGDLVVGIDCDWVEWERRQRHGLGAVTDRRTLEVLLAMPEDVAVPLSLFRPGDRRLLRALPYGVVELDGGHVRRLLQPTLSLLSVGLEASTWKQGFRRSGVFASYCARYVVVNPTRRLGDMSRATLEARFYGVGLAVLDGEALDWMVGPAPFHADWFSASSWLMAEHVSEALEALEAPEG